MSQCPNVPTSQFPSSRCPNVPGSHPPNVQMSEPNLPMSWYPNSQPRNLQPSNVPVSQLPIPQLPNFPMSQPPNVPTSQPPNLRKRARTNQKVENFMNPPKGRKPICFVFFQVDFLRLSRHRQTGSRPPWAISKTQSRATTFLLCPQHFVMTARSPKPPRSSVAWDDLARCQICKRHPDSSTSTERACVSRVVYWTWSNIRTHLATSI